VALAAFFAGITPTATAAAVIVSFLRGRVEYVIAAFVITNLSIAAIMPLVLPWILGHGGSGGFAHVLGTVAGVIFIPAALAFLLRRIHPRAAEWPAKLRGVSFGLWVLALFLICANASQFIRSQVDAPTKLIVQIATTTLVVCAINFAVGYVIGGPNFRREASQSLGQKNTTFTIYLALTYASPLVALGPTFYVVWHNLWNSWQLHRAGKIR
jgi:BASS family bile acid:Na+ symporter